MMLIDNRGLKRKFEMPGAPVRGPIRLFRTKTYIWLDAIPYNVNDTIT